jgi:DNA-binding response OmpR family regulator
VICPNCGLSVTRDETIERDGFVIDPRGAVSYNGTEIPLSSCQREIFYTLARFKHDVEFDVLVNRAGKENNAPGAAMHHVSDIRCKLRASNCPNPIISVKAVGYRWVAPDQIHVSHRIDGRWKKGSTVFYQWSKNERNTSWQ